MDIVKDFFEAIGSRIRSHFFGSIAIAFIYFNWKPLYFLLFTDNIAFLKFNYFDASTTQQTLLWNPLIYGGLLALFTPWLAVIGTIWAAYPSKLIKNIQAVVASDNIAKKYELETQRASEKAKLDQQILERAKAVDEELGEISDPDLRAQTVENLAEARKIGDEIASKTDYKIDEKLTKLAFNLPNTARDILTFSATFGFPTISLDYFSDHSTLLVGGTSFRASTDEESRRIAASLDALIQTKLLINVSPISNKDQIFRLSNLGIELANYLVALDKENTFASEDERQNGDLKWQNIHP